MNLFISNFKMKLFIKYFIKSIILISIIFLINYLVDFHNPNSRFTKNYFKLINKNDSIGISINYSERNIIKKRIFENEIKDTIIIGSSRSLLIGKPINLNCSNYAVSGATLNDYVEIIDLLLKRNINNKTFYIEITPWLFNKNVKDFRYKELNGTENFKKLFSYSYLLDNLQIDKIHVKPDKNDLIRYKDGTIKYGESKNYLIGDSLNIKSYIKNQPIYHLENFNKIEKSELIKFEKIIKKLNQKNIKIKFILYPYPDLISEHILTHYPQILTTEKFIINLSKKYNIKISGSLLSLNSSHKNYFDGMHMNEIGIKNILNKN